MAKKPKKAPVVAVLNLKGGVGKTTISAHLFRVFFQQFRAGTLLIDLDPQFNLTQALFKRDEYDDLKANGITMASVMEASPPGGLFDIKTTNTPVPDPEELAVQLWHFPRTDPVQALRILPGDFALSKYSLMSDNNKLDFVRKRFRNFIGQAREKYKVVCIDCNPSSSFLTLCALQVCTHVLVPVRPDRYSILGLELLAEFVEGIPYISPKPKFIVLLNGVPRTGYDTSIEDELRAHEEFGALTLASKINHSRILTAHPDYTGFATDKKVPYRMTLRLQLGAVAKELKDRLGMQT